MAVYRETLSDFDPEDCEERVQAAYDELFRVAAVYRDGKHEGDLGLVLDYETRRRQGQRQTHHPQPAQRLPALTVPLVDPVPVGRLMRVGATADGVGVPRPLKIVQLALEETVLDGRRASRSNAQIALACTQALWDRDMEGSVSEAAVKRYLATLDEHTIPALHAPQAAEQNAVIAVDVVARINRLDELLQKWIEQAENAGRSKWGVMWDQVQQKVIAADEAGDAIEPVEIFEVDWQARSHMATVMLKHLAQFTDLMERLFDAEQVKAFQQEVMTAIEEADPATARKIVERLQSRQSAVRARLLGVNV